MDSAGGGPDFVIIDGEDFVEIARTHIAPPARPGDPGPGSGSGSPNGLYYSCMMETPVFITLARGWFAGWRRDCVTDYALDPPEDGTAEAYWHGMGLPLLDELIDASPPLAGALLKPNAHTLCTLCGSSDRSKVRYLMMSIEDLIVTPKVVRIDGLAARLG